MQHRTPSRRRARDLSPRIVCNFELRGNNSAIQRSRAVTISGLAVQFSPVVPPPVWASGEMIGSRSENLVGHCRTQWKLPCEREFTRHAWNDAKDRVIFRSSGYGTTTPAKVTIAARSRSKTPKTPTRDSNRSVCDCFCTDRKLLLLAIAAAVRRSLRVRGHNGEKGLKSGSRPRGAPGLAFQSQEPRGSP